MLQLSQRGARYLSVHAWRIAAARFYPTQNTNRNIIMETTTVTDWNVFFTLVNLFLQPEQDFRTIERETRGEADLNISLLYQTLHHYALS